MEKGGGYGNISNFRGGGVIKFSILGNLREAGVDAVWSYDIYSALEIAI